MPNKVIIIKNWSHIERLTRSKFCGGSAAAPAATLKAEKAIWTRGPSPLSLQISPFVIYISLANNDAFLQVKTDIICYDTRVMLFRVVISSCTRHQTGIDFHTCTQSQTIIGKIYCCSYFWLIKRILTFVLS